MRLKAKPIIFGVPVLLVAGLVLGLSLWAWGPLVASGGGGVKDGLTYKGIVEYTVTGPDGVLKDHKVYHNAVNITPGFDAAAARLTGAQFTSDLDLAGAANEEGQGLDAFSKILAAKVVRSSAAAGSGTADDYGTTDGLVSLGDNQADVTVGNNPAQASAANLSVTADGTGVATIKVTFQAEATQAIAELALVKTAAIAAALDISAIVDAAVLATQAVTITLENNDTLDVTWTVDINP
jgi:hypothetical protein